MEELSLDAEGVNFNLIDMEIPAGVLGPTPAPTATPTPAAMSAPTAMPGPAATPALVASLSDNTSAMEKGINGPLSPGILHDPSPPPSPPCAPSLPPSPRAPLLPPSPCAPSPQLSPLHALLPSVNPHSPSPPVEFAGSTSPVVHSAVAAPAASQAKRDRDEGTDDSRTSKRVRSGTITPVVGVAPASISAQARTRCSKAKEAVPATSAPPVPVANPLTGPLEPAANVPKWFVAAIKKLQSKDIDPRFTTLIRTWAAFEVKENHNEIAKLDSKHRPSKIGDWIQWGRNEKWNPPKLIADKFEKQFLLWWHYLQPMWRREDDKEIIWGSITGDLTHLKKPGTNGLLSVVAGLFFWGINVEKGTLAWDKFIMCVDDVQAVMSALVWPPAPA